MWEIFILLMFIFIWVCFAVFGGLWGALLGWLPAQIICSLLL